MAAENYARIMDHVFEFEGGYVDHPNDPGGATNMGITIGTLRDWRGGKVTKSDVRELTKAEASEIYRKNYWDAVQGDALPSGVDICAMDSAVNSGPGRGARWLQRAIGASADGVVGPATLAKSDDLAASVVINRMCDDRMNFLRGLSHWSTFGRGWERRVEAVRELALELSARESHPVPIIAQPAPAPAPPARNDEPVSTSPRSSPMQQVAKAAGAGKWAALGGAIWTVIVSADILPAQYMTTEFSTAVGALIVAAASVIGAYRAPANAE